MPHYPADPSANPVVAILGRPNVGKSTMFNRLAQRTASIVKDEPGVTRDRIYAEADIDGRPVTVIDTGGWEFSPETETAMGINEQCRKAMAEATVILFVVDGQNPFTADDFETATMLRKSKVPAILVVNKIDGFKQESVASDIYELGMSPVIMVSSVHGRGFIDLEDEIVKHLPEYVPPVENEPDYRDAEIETDEEADDENGGNKKNEYNDNLATRVAIIGRPNAGKSSLINKLLNEERLLTLDMPGTTRDSVDTLIKWNDKEYVLVDTAGIRRKSKVKKESPEYLAVSSAITAMTSCRVVVLMIDASGEVAEQDAKILGLAVDRGRAVVIALNKWDLLDKENEKKGLILEQVKQKLAFAPWAKTVTISALEGNGLNKLLNTVDEVAAEFTKRISTSKLNDLFMNIVDHHPPPMRKGRPVKLYFATQAGVRPPSFVVQCSYPEALHFSYRRYVENRIREEFGFEGTPLKMIFKQRERHDSRKPK